MRYPSDAAPDPSLPYGESMHAMLTLSMVLSIVIGAVLLFLGIRGRILWLSVWSGGLILCAIAYLLVDYLGLL